MADKMIDVNRINDIKVGTDSINDNMYMGTDYTGYVEYTDDMVYEHSFPKFFKSMVYRNDFCGGNWVKQDYVKWGTLKKPFWERRTIEGTVNANGTERPIITAKTPMYNTYATDYYTYTVVPNPTTGAAADIVTTDYPTYYTHVPDWDNGGAKVPSRLNWNASSIYKTMQALGLTSDNLEFDEFINVNFKTKGAVYFAMNVEKSDYTAYNYYKYNGTYFEIAKEFLSNDFTLCFYINDWRKEPYDVDLNNLLTLEFGGKEYYIKQNHNYINLGYEYGANYKYDEGSSYTTNNGVTEDNIAQIITNITECTHLADNITHIQQINPLCAMITITKKGNVLSLYQNDAFISRTTLDSTEATADGHLNQVDDLPEEQNRTVCADCALFVLHAYNEALSHTDIKFLWRVLPSDKIDITKHVPCMLIEQDNPVKSFSSSMYYDSEPHPVCRQYRVGVDTPDYSTIKIRMYYADGVSIDVSNRMSYEITKDYTNSSGIGRQVITGTYIDEPSLTLEFYIEYVSDFDHIKIQALDDNLNELYTITSFDNDMLASQYLKLNWFKKLGLRHSGRCTTYRGDKTGDTNADLVCRLSGAYSDCLSLWKAVFEDGFYSSTRDKGAAGKVYGLFRDCINLRYLDLGQTYNENAKNPSGRGTLNNRLCLNCQNLETFIFNPDKFTAIPWTAFNYTPFSKANATGTYWRIGNMLIEVLDKTIETLNVDSTITSIMLSGDTYAAGESPIKDCTNLTTINIPNSVTKIVQNKTFAGFTGTINIDNVAGAIPDAPWGATNATINYLR